MKTKRLISIVLCMAMMLGLFAVVGPAASAADVYYPCVSLGTDLRNCYAGDKIELNFEANHEFKNERYYVSIYDADGEVVFSADTLNQDENNYIFDWAVTWNTAKCEKGKYKIVTEAEFYYDFRWNESPNIETYYVTLQDPANKPVIGWNHDSDGWWYLKEDGFCYFNEWALINSNWYYFDNAYMATGWKKLDGFWYYFRSNGAMATGWERVGKTYYYLEASGEMKTGWLKLDGSWYYLRSNGAMAIGWERVNGTWYHFDSNGRMQTGWIKDGNNYYYLSSTTGAMRTGWKRSGDVYYYLRSTGVMATGWELVDGTWYFFNGGGKMLTGWQKISDKWYFFYDTGAMAANCYVGSYWLNADGAWEEKGNEGGFVLIGGNVYYHVDGVPVKGLYLVDGAFYYFSTGNGRMAVDQTIWVKSDNAYGLPAGNYTIGEDGKLIV